MAAGTSVLCRSRMITNCRLNAPSFCEYSEVFRWFFDPNLLVWRDRDQQQTSYQGRTYPFSARLIHPNDDEREWGQITELRHKHGGEWPQSGVPYRRHRPEKLPESRHWVVVLSKSLTWSAHTSIFPKISAPFHALNLLASVRLLLMTLEVPWTPTEKEKRRKELSLLWKKSWSQLTQLFTHYDDRLVWSILLLLLAFDTVPFRQDVGTRIDEFHIEWLSNVREIYQIILLLCLRGLSCCRDIKFL